MCIAIPSRVLGVDGYSARIECYGVEREVSLLLCPEVEEGDYVLVQTGLVVERLDEATARESLAMFDEILFPAEPLSG